MGEGTAQEHFKNPYEGQSKKTLAWIGAPNQMGLCIKKGRWSSILRAHLLQRSGLMRLEQQVYDFKYTGL